jgi:hypothetical protein
MHNIRIVSVSMCGFLFSSRGMVGSVYIMESGGKYTMTCVSFVWCIICGSFFVRYGEDSDCVLVFFSGKVGPMYGFL